MGVYSDKNDISRVTSETLFLPQESKIHISDLPCNVLFIIRVRLGFKPLVQSVRRYIRDTRDIFPVCHSRECRIGSTSGCLLD